MKRIAITLAAILPLAGFARDSFALRAPTTGATASDSATEYDRAQISAATANARVNLRKDVERHWLTPQLTVGEFVKRAKGEDALRAAVREAEQIGGPRWIDDQTCQIKVEMHGAHIARALVEIARNDPQRTVPPEEVERRLADWDQRSFTGTGTSIAADKVHEVRPIGVPAWRIVDDAARIAAIDAARENAIQRVLDELRSLRLDDKLTLGEVLARNEPVTERLTTLLRNRPVTSIRFTSDLQVHYTLSVSRRQLVEEFLIASKQAGVELPPDATQEKLHPQFRQEITSTTGTSIAKPAGDIALVEAPNFIPAQPPRWVFQQVEASGTAKFQKSPLLTKQEAEEAANAALRSKLLNMQLSQGVSLAEAVERDITVRAAVDRALWRARTVNVEYGADGSVTVTMLLDPRDLWSDLSRP